MADFTDTGVTDEAGWGGTGYDLSGDNMHLSPRERRKARDRKKARQERWRAALDVRATWTQAQFEEEARQIAAQIAEWEAQRDAA